MKNSSIVHESDPENWRINPWRNSTDVRPSKRTLLVLDLCLHVVNGVGTLNFKSDGLSSKRFYEDLHA